MSTENKHWYKLRDDETIEDYRNRRLVECPILNTLQLEVLIQLTHAVWDGYVVSKTARDELVDKGLVVRYNGWQIVTEEGLAVLLTLRKLPTIYSSKNF